MNNDHSSKEKKFISAVVYLRNDSERIDPFMDMVTSVLNDNFTGYEIIFVNDASTDDSVEKIHRYIDAHRDDVQAVTVIELSHFQGLESAMNAGRDFAIGDFVYEFDDMLTDYDPSLVMEIYNKVLSGYDIVSAGCKNASSTGSRVFYGLYNRLNSSGEALTSETFRLLSRRSVNQVKSLDHYIPYRKAIYMNCGLNTATEQYASSDPAKRKSLQRGRHDRFSLAMDSLIYFTNAMEKLAIGICIVFAIIAVAVGVDIIYETAAFTHPVEGWRSTMGFLAIGFFGVFLVLAVVMRYLSVLVNLTFRKSRYLIAGVEKVTSK